MEKWPLQRTERDSQLHRNGKKIFLLHAVPISMAQMCLCVKWELLEARKNSARCHNASNDSYGQHQELNRGPSNDSPLL